MGIRHENPLQGIKAIRDAVEVHIHDNDVEAGIRALRRRALVAGVLRSIRIREENPKKSMRLKVKAMRAKSNRLRTQARQAASGRRG